MSTVEEKPKRKMASPVQPFMVEITGNCSDVIIQSIPGCKLRGQVKAIKRVFSPYKTKPTMAPSGVFPGLPELPGMRVSVNPGNCVVEITDPLHGDEETCAVIKALVKRHRGTRTVAKVDGVPPREIKLDKSRIKTLCRELLFMTENDMAKFVKARGEKPTMEDIEKLPGHFLLNPGSQIPNNQPRYEKDMDAYVQRLESTEAT